MDNRERVLSWSSSFPSDLVLLLWLVLLHVLLENNVFVVVKVHISVEEVLVIDLHDVLYLILELFGAL